MIELWDIQTGFGGARPGHTVISGCDELLAIMDRLSIARALARITPVDLDVDIERSNRRLIEACQASGERLSPCPIVVPNGADDLPDEPRQLDHAIEAGAPAVWVRPETDHWSTAAWCAGALFRSLTERRMPAVMRFGAIPLETTADLALAYPDVPLILIGLDYRSQRSLLPLLETFSNIHVSIGSNYTVNGGIEQLCRRIGANRLLFGSGVPEIEAAASIGALLYADISPAEKALIGSGNLQRLREAIR